VGVGREVEISIRPESVQLVPASTDGQLAGSVEQVAFLGNSTQYRVRTAGGNVLTALVPRTGIRVPVGEQVALTWIPDEALILRHESATTEEDQP
jgi:spermidine/putrescine transport system ATP-binding protein